MSKNFARSLIVKRIGEEPQQISVGQIFLDIIVDTCYYINDNEYQYQGRIEDATK